MKTILILLVGAITAMAQVVPYDGQQKVLDASGAELNGGTNKVTALTTNGGFYGPIDLSLSESVFLFCSFKYLNAVGSADVNAIRIDFYRGIDKVTFETNVFTSWIVQAGSTTTTANGQATNMNLLGVPYLRCKLANISTNAHATNFYLTYGVKL